jgi:hypothetical protein
MDIAVAALLLLWLLLSNHRCALLQRLHQLFGHTQLQHGQAKHHIPKLPTP